tara:strand:- start:488 stop:868 length:381 start_codon:yes stop_codon:yes gene_type:complete
MGKKSALKRYGDHEAMAFGKMIRTSPQKMNLVAQSIRGKSCEVALNSLTFSTRRIAKDVKKVLQAAIANAENNQQLDIDRLYVAEATCGRAFVMKRWRPRARGRTGRIFKPFSNLTIVLREREEAA